MTSNMFDLPQIVTPARAEYLSHEETRLMDMAEALIQQGNKGLRLHRDAVTIARELGFAHEADNPADEALHYCAEQLALCHLEYLAEHLSVITSPFLK